MITIVVTLSLVGLSSYGISLLKAEFKAINYVNKGTYIREFYDLYAEKFPNVGISGDIYLVQKPNFHQYMEETIDMLNE